MLVIGPLLVCGCTALNNAAFKGDLGKLGRLIDGGADLNKCASCTWEGPDGVSAVGCAGHQDRVEVVRALFAKGADPNACGGLSFYFAAMSEDPEIIQAFLDAGADPNRARALSAIRESPAAAQMLIDAGADPLAEDYSGTVLDGARKRSTQAVVAIMEQAADPAARAKRVLRRRYEERRPQIESAERQGDEQAKQGNASSAVAAYLAGYRLCPSGLEAKERLFSKLTDVARLAATPIPIPAEAQAHADRAESFLRLADDEKGYARAAVELEQALDAAPWWAEAYYNLGLTREKARDFTGAATALKLYLRVSPNAPEAPRVRKKITDLEVAQELRR